MYYLIFIHPLYIVFINTIGWLNKKKCLRKLIKNIYSSNSVPDQSSIAPFNNTFSPNAD